MKLARKLERLAHLRYQPPLDAGADALAGVGVLDQVVAPALRPSRSRRRFLPLASDVM